MAAPIVQEVRPLPLDSTSEPPPLFDGTTRLYINYLCPFAQRVWIARNLKGLQEKIKLVPINLQNRPTWYKEKVYPENKVPALEHDNKVTGESLDLLKYLDSHFEGPTLLPNDPAKREFAEELISYTDKWTATVYTSFKGDPVKEAGSSKADSSPMYKFQNLIPASGGAFDYLETALHKFDDGPFFLGQLSHVDIAYAPHFERCQIFLEEVFKYNIFSGRPKLAAWFEELNKIDAYTQTKSDPQEIVEFFRNRYLAQK